MNLDCSEDWLVYVAKTTEVKVNAWGIKLLEMSYIEPANAASSTSYTLKWMLFSPEITVILP
jgi:hypothetical protein